MWFLVILFLPFAILLVSLEEHSKNKNTKREYEELSETIQNLENECAEINNLINQIEEVNNLESNFSEDTLYYDDTVSEEIQQTIENIQDDKLTSNEVIFLKFMNNKSTKISFSSRWEFMYDLKPIVEIAKLKKQGYLTYSSWYDNVQNATIKELKEILKKEDLKVSGNKQELVERVLENIDADLLEETFNKGKYILTSKGKEIIEKNKRLFMSDREKAGEEFAELTDYEYNFLKELGQTEEYIRLKNNELSFNKGYGVKDILWSIYNIQKEKMVLARKYEKASIIYDKMFRICFNEGRYTNALIFLLCSSYLEGYNTIKEVEEENEFSMEDWFYINIHDMNDRIKIIEEKTSIIKDKGIDWLILNSIDKYLKSINKAPVRRAFKNKLKRIFSQLPINDK